MPTATPTASTEQMNCPRIQPEKDIFVVVADFFRYFDFDTAFLLSLINRLNSSYNSCILYVKEALNYGY